MFSSWPCYKSDGSRIGLRIDVWPRGEAEGQYSYPKAYTIGRGPVTRPLWKHPFHNIFINQLFIFKF